MEVGKLFLVLIFSVIPVLTIQPGGKFFIINKKYIYPSKQQRQAKSTTTESIEQIKTTAGVTEITVPGKAIRIQPVIPIVANFSVNHQINIEQVRTTGGFNQTTKTTEAPTTIGIKPKTTTTDPTTSTYPEITTYRRTITFTKTTTIGPTTTSTCLDLKTTTDPKATRVQTTTTNPTTTTTNPTTTTTDPTPTTTEPTTTPNPRTTTDPTTAIDPKLATSKTNTRNPAPNTYPTTTTAKPIISTISPSIITPLPNITTPAPESTTRTSKKGCNGKLSDTRKHFGSKTPAISKHVESMTPEGCTAEQIWILGMQGAEYPSNEDIQEMQYDLPVLRNAIKEKANQEWSPNPKMVNKLQHWLVKEGYEEWRDISSRFQKRFPSLFPNTFNSDRYYFRGTGEQSSQKSAMAFAGAIFGNSLDSLMIAPPMINDPVLQFYKKCAKYIKYVKKNPEVAYEAAKFLESPVFKSALKELGLRLGLNRDVTKEETLLMYKTCKYETVWKSGKMSPWCNVFDGKDFDILEYYQDLQDYWKEGYAYPIAYEQACMPLKDMVDTFTAKISSENEYYHNRSRMGKRLTTAYFGSREAILKIYARLGLLQFQNQDRSSGILKNASDSNTSHSSRRWMYERMGGSASNIAFVLFSCAQSHSDFRKWVNYRHRSIGPTWKIGTLVQEQPVVLPIAGCQGDWLCSFDDFVKSFEHVLNTCDLNEMCKV